MFADDKNWKQKSLSRMTEVMQVSTNPWLLEENATLMTSIISKEHALQDSDVCCPKFKPELWDNITHWWNNKLFLKDAVPELFHIPLPGTYKHAITRMWNQADHCGAAPNKEDFLLLAHDPSSFKGELYMSITRDIPGANVVKLTGAFFSRVFHGGYGDVPRFLKEMTHSLAANKMRSAKDYVFFPYCPECSKKYGESYVVIISEIVRD
jgi:hypothetical protein